MVITCMQKKMKIKFNSIKNVREITCIQKRVNIRSNINAGSHGVHLHAEGRAAMSTTSDVSTGHIFSLDF